MASLDGVRLKLGRAEEHLSALDMEVRRYIKGCPYARLREYDPDHGERTRGFTITESPPPHLSLVVGDVAHNLRCGLDYLAWQLVLANGGSPTCSTAFPIFDSRTDRKGRVRRIAINGGVEAGALAVIESLQPYHRGKGATCHPLALIGALSNLDKHRHLAPAAHWVPNLERAEFALPAGVGGIGSAKPGTDTVYFLPSPLLPGENVDMHLQAALLVSLDEPPGFRERDIVQLLKELLEFVRHNVVAGLAPFVD